jgi:hypothetical protein
MGSGLPKSGVTETELRGLLGKYGEIVNVRIMSDKFNDCKGYGFVRFRVSRHVVMMHDIESAYGSCLVS